MELYKSKYSDGKTDGRDSRRDNETSRSFRNSGDKRYSGDDRRESTSVTCADCGNQCTVPFVPRSNKPVYCSDCFRQNKPQDSGNDRYSRDDRSSRNSRDDRYSKYSRDDRGSRNSRDNDREDTEVTCADCGNQCTVPFVPRSNKPVYCSDCFRQNKPQDSGNDRYSRDDRSSRYSRDDRSSRYSRDDRRESSRDNSRTRKSKNDKISKKQAGFFSNGSDKFYETIKEKIFEILGGKTCSNCGFKDERALGIRPISDDVSFDNNGRGGEASSWGKYISSPDLAKEELKILCLNCNEIREPVTKLKEDTPKSKKSKYFPR